MLTFHIIVKKIYKEKIALIVEIKIADEIKKNLFPDKTVLREIVHRFQPKITLTLQSMNIL